MYCSSCGDEVAESAQYCSNCGVILNDSVQNDHPSPPTGGVEQRQQIAGAESNTGLAALTHILALFTWIWGPLIVLLVSKDEFVKQNARNAMNWQIFLTIYSVISIFLMLLIIGFLTFVVVFILDIVFCIVAAIKASDGQAWKYPLTADLV